MKSKRFALYEVVRVSHPLPDNEEARNLTGAVLGFATAENGNPTCGVLLEKIERVWMMEERELTSTGVIGRREDHYPPGTG